MRKRIISYLALFVFVLLIVVLISKLVLVNAKVSFQDDSGATFKIGRSYIGGMFFNNFLEEQGVWSEGLYVRSSGEKVKPEKIKFILSGQELSNVVYGGAENGGAIASFGDGYFAGDVYIIPIYVTPSFLSDFYQFEWHINLLTYYSVMDLVLEDGIIGRENSDIARAESLDLVGDISKENYWVLVGGYRPRSSDFRTIIEFFRRLFRVSKTYAGYYICTGRVWCGIDGPNGCEGGGSSGCYWRGQCPPSSPCGNYYIVCQETCGLDYVCDSNDWSSWSSCSEPCDGGTQYRVNDCRDRQWRACNTQPCCTPTNPGVTTLVSPSDDSHLDFDVVTLDWDPVSAWGVGCPSNNNQYQIYVEADDATPDVLVNTVSSATTSYDFTLTPGLQYYWQIVATNGSKTAGSAIWTFILDPLVEGTVYYDPDNACSTSSPSNFGGITASIRDTSDADAVVADGTFAVRTAYGGGNILDMEAPAGHTCSVGPLGTGCGAGCPSQTNVFAPSVGNNFFFTDNPVSWWQVVGASVYSGSDVGGQTIRSLIPLTISASSRYLILSPPGGTDAVAIRRSGSLILSNGEVSSSGYSVLSGYGGRTYDYDFWTAQIGVGLDPAGDFLGDSINKPVNDPSKEFYYASPDAIYIDFGSPWNVVSGESYVVMVDGDLRINQNITVANGGFLAFIVSGDVDVDPSVTDIQGVFIVDGAFNTESQYDEVILDSQLAVEGTVVAWANISLNRDLGDVGNAAGAAETFTYRPDFIINMPESMKAFILRWREMPAGTIGD